MYRFTDWYNEERDCYGSYEECLVLFNKAVMEDKEARVSIYLVEDREGDNGVEEP